MLRNIRLIGSIIVELFKFKKAYTDFWDTRQSKKDKKLFAFLGSKFMQQGSDGCSTITSGNERESSIICISPGLTQSLKSHLRSRRSRQGPQTLSRDHYYLNPCFIDYKSEQKIREKERTNWIVSARGKRVSVICMSF